jgi:multidrug efflux pump subunit AcrA (membrane-fusion protein)
MSEKNKSLTIFKTDRHEDIAAIIFSGLVVVVVLSYMAFVVPTVTIKVPQDGKLVEIFVTEGTEVAKGDKLYSLEIVKKKWVNNVLEEKKVVEEFTAKTSGKILKVAGNPGDDVKKGKHAVVVMDHQKGTLP